MVKHSVNDSDRRGALYVIIYTTIILIVMIYLMIGSWPAATEDLDLNATSTFNHTTTAFNQINDINSTRIATYPPFGNIFLGPETLLVIIMMISGAMGACLFSLWAASHHLGKENDFDYLRYKMWYYSRPMLGAGLAFIFYLLVRGGLLTIGAAVLTLNIVVIAGLSGLVGMFSEQALLKLLEVADAIFGPGNKEKTPEAEATEELEEAKKSEDEAKKRVEKAEKKYNQAKEKNKKAQEKAANSRSEEDIEAAKRAKEEEDKAAKELETEKANYEQKKQNTAAASQALDELKIKKNKK